MSRLRLAIAIVIALAVLAMPLLGNNYILRLATIMLMYATLAMAWNFIGGFAGYPSFGLAAFFGLGAYPVAVLELKGLPIPLVWIFSAVVVTQFRFFRSAILLRFRVPQYG